LALERRLFALGFALRIELSWVRVPARLRLEEAVADVLRPLDFRVAEAAVRRPALRLVEVEPMLFFCPRDEVPVRL
jgi:hypothetical protein